MSCRFVASDKPRVMTQRHNPSCDEPDCRGCQPCQEPHCRVCNRTHADGSCAECLASTRETLHDIARLCDALPEEVEHRGIEGEAMMLLGPVADPEAWGHVEASVQSGRLDTDWVEAGGGDLHPLTVLLSWQMVARDALDHNEAPDSELATAVDYLDGNLTYLGGYEHLPFEDMAHELRRCLTHLEAVLHDGEQRDTGAPCLDCRIPLVREWGQMAASDGWRCPKCRVWRSDEDYRRNVADLHGTHATHLTDRDMEIRTGIRAGTVREWARRGDVTRRLESGRTVYAVCDVIELARKKGMMSA
jgi:hypothetical protein